MRPIARIAMAALRRVRFGNWWAHKIPPLLLIVYADLVRRRAPPGPSFRALAVVIVCVPCVAAYGHVINDWCDVDDDARAGKPNAMRDVPVARRFLLCAGLVAAPFLVLAPLANARPARAALALNLLWPTVYSIPGVRLKERGLLGVLCDAAGSHVTPTLFALAATAALAPGRAGLALDAAALAWASALGIKGILYHQIADRANDESADVTTFATSVDARRLSSFLGRYNLCVELPLSAIFVAMLVPFEPLALVAFATYVAIEGAKAALGFEFAVSRDARLRRRSVPFANEMFSTLWLPLASVAQLALKGRAFAWLPLVHVALFREQFAVQLADLRALRGQLAIRSRALRSRWSGR